MCYNGHIDTFMDTKKNGVDTMTEDVKQMLTTEDVAFRLNVKRKTIIRLIESGDLPASKLGRVYRIDPDDLQEFLSRTKTPAHRER